MHVCRKCGGERTQKKSGSTVQGQQRYQLRCAACDSAREKLRPKRSTKIQLRGPKKTASNNKWEIANPEKRTAHKRVERAVRSGRLERRPCERCGSEVNVHAHHDDYSRPLEVMWLCQLHHKERHRELAATAANDLRAVSPSLPREAMSRYLPST